MQIKPYHCVILEPGEEKTILEPEGKTVEKKKEKVFI